MVYKLNNATLKSGETILNDLREVLPQDCEL
jgi:hypothetical protein